MAVPKHIREVPRPINTVVIDNGNDGPTRYAVRERKGIQYVSGGNPQPKNGKVIGHIVDGVYVPKHQAILDAAPDMLSYGAAAFVHSVSSDLLSELLEIYSAKDAYTIMAIVVLCIIKPEITASRMSTHYRRTYVSKYYPSIAISPNSIPAFYQMLGQAGQLRKAFYQLRASKVVQDHHVAIDGTLKQDHVVYKKAAIKGRRYLYAYKSSKKTRAEEASYLARREKKKDFASEKYINTPITSSNTSESVPHPLALLLLYPIL